MRIEWSNKWSIYSRTWTKPQNKSSKRCPLGITSRPSQQRLKKIATIGWLMWFSAMTLWMVEIPKLNRQNKSEKESFWKMSQTLKTSRFKSLMLKKLIKITSLASLINLRPAKELIKKLLGSTLVHKVRALQEKSKNHRGPWYQKLFNLRITVLIKWESNTEKCLPMQWFHSHDF